MLDMWLLYQMRCELPTFYMTVLAFSNSSNTDQHGSHLILVLLFENSNHDQKVTMETLGYLSELFGNITWITYQVELVS